MRLFLEISPRVLLRLPVHFASSADWMTYSGRQDTERPAERADNEATQCMPEHHQDAPSDPSKSPERPQQAPSVAKETAQAPRSRHNSLTRQHSLGVSSKASSRAHDDADGLSSRTNAQSASLGATSQDTTPRSGRGASEVQAAVQDVLAPQATTAAPMTPVAAGHASTSDTPPAHPGSPGVAPGLARRAERTASAHREHTHSANTALQFRDRQLACSFAAALRPASPIAARIKRRSSGTLAPSILSRSQSASLSQSNLAALDTASAKDSSSCTPPQSSAGVSTITPAPATAAPAAEGSFAAAVRGTHLERAQVTAADFATGVAGPALGTGPRLGIARSSSQGRVKPRRVRRNTQVCNATNP